jgi:hypothetical protein
MSNRFVLPISFNSRAAVAACRIRMEKPETGAVTGFFEPRARRVARIRG